jgi:uncharacterized protein (DUF1501 family)
MMSKHITNKRPAVNVSRRAFLKRGSALIAAGVTSPIAINLAAISEAAAATANDYKAIVCIFLYGGNDNYNTVVPYDEAGYNTYRSLRQNLSYTRSSLAATALAPTVVPLDRNGVPHTYALAPNMLPLKSIFDEGRLGVTLNIGPLVQPTTKSQYNNRSVPLPPRLFSHNDQQSIWQSLAPEGAPSGWGGRMGDLFESGNGRAIFTSINLSENTVFSAGELVTQYKVNPRANEAPFYNLNWLFGSRDTAQALQTLITQSRPNLLENQHNIVTQRAITAGTDLFAQVSTKVISTPYPTQNTLADQLKMVAKIIASADELTVKRQVFFVSIGGFDNHDALLINHPVLLKRVADAMKAFYETTKELGVANQVTTFTASDFGRSLVGNNDGSDHGWGSGNIVMGGAVLGRTYYGTAPLGNSKGLDDVGAGSLLPTTSVDQFAATLGKWMGASDSDLLDILPNLKNFNPIARNLGFV